MQLELNLTLPVDSRWLAVTRATLTMYLAELGMPSYVVDDVILAMDEACANVLLHAYPEGYQGNYRLCAHLDPERIQIEVVDDGTGFDQMSKPPARDEDAQMSPSGRGLEVMRRLMTTVEVESPTEEGGTRLRLTRLVPSTSE